jgi:hypothetical protein
MRRTITAALVAAALTTPAYASSTICNIVDYHKNTFTWEFDFNGDATRNGIVTVEETLFATTNKKTITFNPGARPRWSVSINNKTDWLTFTQKADPSWSITTLPSNDGMAMLIHNDAIVGKGSCTHDAVLDDVL